MPIISGGGGGGTPFNGGTITNPLTIDLTGDLVDRTALDVKLPDTFGFSVKPFTFRLVGAGGFVLLDCNTNGRVTTGGNPLYTLGGGIVTTGGAINTGGGAVNLGTGLLSSIGGTAEFATPGGLADAFAVDVSAATPKLGFFNAAPRGAIAAIPDASAGVVIDAEARTALNTLLAAVRALGLVNT